MAGASAWKVETTGHAITRLLLHPGPACVQWVTDQTTPVSLEFFQKLIAQLLAFSFAFSGLKMVKKFLLIFLLVIAGWWFGVQSESGFRKSIDEAIATGVGKKLVMDDVVRKYIDTSMKEEDVIWFLRRNLFAVETLCKNEDCSDKVILGRCYRYDLLRKFFLHDEVRISVKIVGGMVVDVSGVVFFDEI